MQLKTFFEVKENIIKNYGYYDVQLTSNSGKTIYHDEKGIEPIYYINTKVGNFREYVVFNKLNEEELKKYVPDIEKLAIEEYEEHLNQYKEYIDQHMKKELKYCEFLKKFNHIIEKYSYVTNPNGHIIIHLNNQFSNNKLIDCDQDVVVYHIKTIVKQNPYNKELILSKETELTTTHLLEFDFIKDVLEDEILKFDF